jgi:hypothetical protein
MAKIGNGTFNGPISLQCSAKLVDPPGREQRYCSNFAPVSFSSDSSKRLLQLLRSAPPRLPRTP